MRDYTKIKAWEYADNLTVMIYASTTRFPREEIYGLTSQLRRSAYSVPSNISEGSARGSKRDYLHFLYISRGSLAEARYFLHLSRRLGYLREEEYRSLEDQARATAACLQGLIKAVEGEVGVATRIAATVTGLLVLSCTWGMGALLAR